jgi:hypothetical protein
MKIQINCRRPLHVQGDAGHPGLQGGGQEKNNWKKWRAKEEEKHKGSLTQTAVEVARGAPPPQKKGKKIQI